MNTTIDTEVIEKIKHEIKKNLGTRFHKLDSAIQNLLHKEAILTGGAIASLFHGKVPNDWDLYLKDEAAIENFKHFIQSNPYIIKNHVKDINPKYMVDTEIEGKLITAHATTFDNDIQVITMATSEFRDTFDFIHCMPWYDIKTGKLHISPAQYEAIKNKKLVLNPKAKKKPTARRVEKYVERGWLFNEIL